jgi:hypothetical protein
MRLRREILSILSALNAVRRTLLAFALDRFATPPIPIRSPRSRQRSRITCWPL